MLKKCLLVMMLVCVFCSSAVGEEIVLDKGDYQVAIWMDDWENFASEYAAFDAPEELLEYAANAIARIVDITGHEDWLSVYSTTKVLLDSTTGGTQIYGGYFSNQNPKPYVYLQDICMQHGVAAITHELTHIVCQHYSSLTLREGLAQYINWLIGGQEDMLIFEMNPHLVFQNIIRTSKTNETYLREVGKFNNTKNLALWIKKGRSASFYLASYSFAKYMIETYGMDVYMAIYGAASEEAYPAETGKTLETLQKEWLAYTDTFEGQYDRQAYLSDISTRLIEHGFDEAYAQTLSTEMLKQLE